MIMNMNELDQRERGYIDEKFALKSVFFANNVVLLSNSIEEIKEDIQIITDTSKKFGLEINLEKSSILLFNMKEQLDEL